MAKTRLGVAYYPECFDASEWQRDVDWMAEGGINTVRLAEFAWAKMEVAEGVFDFDWLERFIELARRADIQAVLCTPTEAPPPWLTATYPDVLPIGPEGLRRGAGGRRHYCINNRHFQRCSDRITEAMGTRFGGNPNVIAWQLDNEAACHDSLNCYCGTCRDEFRAWLRRKYVTVEAVNDAWYASFWSHDLTSFDDVMLHTNSRTGISPQTRLDLIRFGGDCWVRFLDGQAEILRRLVRDQRITHNITWYQEMIDMYRLTEKLDFVSIDLYQREPYRMSLIGAWFAAIKPDRKFWVMEMPSGIRDDEAGLQRPMPPEKLRSYFLRHYLRGAEACSMWHFRRHLGGQEMWLGACLDHNGRPCRAFEGVAEVGRFIRRHDQLLAANRPVYDVAILHSYDDLLLALMHPRPLGFATDQVIDALLGLYEALERLGMGVTFRRPADDLGRFSLVFAPQTFVVTPAIAEKLKAYVAAGGVLVGSNRMGQFDEFGRAQARDLPAFLADLFGVTIGRVDEAPQDAPIRLRLADRWGGAALTCLRGTELLPAQAAETELLGSFESHRIAASPAVAVNRCGAGKAIFVGAEKLCGEAQAVLVEKILAEAGVAFGAPVAARIECIRGDRLTGYFNLAEGETTRLELPERRRDLLTGQVRATWELQPYQAVIFENP